MVQKVILNAALQISLSLIMRQIFILVQ